MKKYLCIFSLLLLSTSCEFESQEIGSPTDLQDGSLTFTYAIIQMATFQGNVSYDHGWWAAQYCAAWRNTGFDQYLWNPNGGVWNESFRALRNIKNVENYGRNSDHPNFLGAALTLKVYAYLLMTSTYGDIPYTDAIKGGEGNFQPAYDRQQDIIPALLETLEEAETLFSPASKQLRGDILFDGDATLWQKFNRSLQLRLLMRISEKTDVTAKIQALATKPLLTSASETAFIYSNEQYVFKGGAQADGQYLSRRLSNFAENWYKERNDPRLFIYFDPASTTAGTDSVTYRGMPNGLSEESSFNYFGGGQYISIINYGRFRQLAGVPLILMHAAEVNFLLAEAINRGFISGDAQGYYEAGIRADFEFLGIADLLDNYLAEPKVQFSTSGAEQYQQIMEQKWQSMFHCGMEGWFDFRRTGLPYLPISVQNANNDRFPKRFIYPQEEQFYNNFNYQNAVNAQGADDINTLMWMLQ